MDRVTIEEGKGTKKVCVYHISGRQILKIKQNRNYRLVNMCYDIANCDELYTLSNFHTTRLCEDEDTTGDAPRMTIDVYLRLQVCNNAVLDDMGNWCGHTFVAAIDEQFKSQDAARLLYVQTVLGDGPDDVAEDKHGFFNDERNDESSRVVSIRVGLRSCAAVCQVTTEDFAEGLGRAFNGGVFNDDQDDDEYDSGTESTAGEVSKRKRRGKEKARVTTASSSSTTSKRPRGARGRITILEMRGHHVRDKRTFDDKDAGDTNGYRARSYYEAWANESGIPLQEILEEVTMNFEKCGLVPPTWIRTHTFTSNIDKTLDYSPSRPSQFDMNVKKRNRAICGLGNPSTVMGKITGPQIAPYKIDGEKGRPEAAFFNPAWSALDRSIAAREYEIDFFAMTFARMISSLTCDGLQIAVQCPGDARAGKSTMIKILQSIIQQYIYWSGSSQKSFGPGEIVTEKALFLSEAVDLEGTLTNLLKNVISGDGGTFPVKNKGSISVPSIRTKVFTAGNEEVRTLTCYEQCSMTHTHTHAQIRYVCS